MTQRGDTFILRGAFTTPINGTWDQQLIVDDGLTNFGYRIKQFKLVPQTYEGQATFYADVLGFLTLDPVGLSRFIFSDSDQIAWAMFDVTSGSGVESDPSFELIDPVVFVRELWLRAWSSPASAGTGRYNYFIELERVTLTDIEALVHLATEVID